jgi:hypothetical protein
MPAVRSEAEFLVEAEGAAGVGVEGLGVTGPLTSTALGVCADMPSDFRALRFTSTP